jgi:hypothetical protein
MPDIRDVLNRRTDLSTFVVHLTRDRDGWSARQVLDAIIRERLARAYTPMGWARGQDDPGDRQAQTQRVVCFSEAPLKHIYSLVGEIEGRQIRLQPYGFALTKMAARRLGINPVWYVDMTPGHDWISPAIEELRDQAVGTGDFHRQPAARILPFFEWMGTWPTTDGQKEFWWEREWRHVGHLQLPESGVIWLCPEEEMDELSTAHGDRAQPCVDPRWGLEQIIARLADIPDGDITPFVPRERLPEYG